MLSPMRRDGEGRCELNCWLVYLTCILQVALRVIICINWRLVDLELIL